MKLSLLIHLLFLVYYAYVVYVFYKLYENSCTCEKLETFKQKPEFKFLFGTSLLFLFFNFHYFAKLCRQQMGGNQEMYLFTLIVISLGYGLSFIFDIVLLKFFRMMKDQHCPCQRKHRDYITPITYGKFAINLFFYLTIMKKLNMKKFMQLLKKAKRNTKGKGKKG